MAVSHHIEWKSIYISSSVVTSIINTPVWYTGTGYYQSSSATIIVHVCSFLSLQRPCLTSRSHDVVKDGTYQEQSWIANVASLAASVVGSRCLYVKSSVSPAYLTCLHTPTAIILATSNCSQNCLPSMTNAIIVFVNVPIPCSILQVPLVAVHRQYHTRHISKCTRSTTWYVHWSSFIWL